MSELTKIAAILLKNLSDALLTTASELNRLNASTTLSQTDEKPELVSIKRIMPTKRLSYKPQEKVIARLFGRDLSHKMRVLKRLSDSEYLLYHQNGAKSESFKVNYEDILGLDPDR